MAEQIKFLDGLKLVEPVKAIRRAVGAVQGFLAVGRTTELCLSTHRRDNTGAAPMLDSYIDDPEVGDHYQEQLFRADS